MNLAERFLEEFYVPVPANSGIDEDNYIKILELSIYPDRLNDLLKKILRAKTLNREQQLELTREKIDLILKPGLQEMLTKEFKKGDEVLSQTQAEQKNKIPYPGKVLSEEEYEKLKQENPFLYLTDICMSALNKPAANDFFENRERRDIGRISLCLADEIVTFVNDRLPIIYHDLDFEFPFDKQLVVVGKKKKYPHKDILIAVDKYQTKMNRRPYGNLKSFKSKISNVLTEARKNGYYDYIDDDNPRYQEYFKILLDEK